MHASEVLLDVSAQSETRCRLYVQRKVTWTALATAPEVAINVRSDPIEAS